MPAHLIACQHPACLTTIPGRVADARLIHACVLQDCDEEKLASPGEADHDMPQAAGQLLRTRSQLL
jgi:hypothetical protein